MHWVVEQILLGRPSRRTISKYAAGADRYLGLLLMISAALLGLAMTQPMITTDSFLTLAGSYSLVSGVLALIKAGQGVAALVISLISLIIPIYLLSSAFDLWYKYELNSDKFPRKAALLRRVGRLWFLSAAGVLAGLYFFRQSGGENVLHFAIYFLLLSLLVLKLVLLRLMPLINAVRFVEDEERQAKS